MSHFTPGAHLSCVPAPPAGVQPDVAPREAFAADTPHLSHAPDERLVLRTRRGDRDAFAGLVDRYERPAMAIAVSILGSWHDARDAVQDAFVTAYERLNRLGSPQKFGPWLLRIARWQALARRRRLASASRRTRPLDDHTPDPGRHEPHMSTDGLALIARLPESECVAVSLRHLDGHTVAEIARITGRPVGTITKQLSRAYARMRTWLDDKDDATTGKSTPAGKR